MTPAELTDACMRSLSQGLDFLPLTIPWKRVKGNKVRALGQLCEILRESADFIVIRASAKKTLKWIVKQNRMHIDEQSRV